MKNTNKWRLGKTYSEIYKNDCSNVGFQKGKNNPMCNKEIAEKAHKKLIGKKQSPEHIAKRALAMKGKSYEELMGKEKAEQLIRRRKEDNIGKNNPCWLGGISYEKREQLIDRFRNIIRKRDNQVCILCGVHREKLNRSLDIHHIDYSKCNNVKENCVSLCHSCHQKTNHNRRYWFEMLHNIMKDRYKYEYSLNYSVIKFKDFEVKYEEI
jgi:hypothetical protein